MYTGSGTTHPVLLAPCSRRSALQATQTPLSIARYVSGFNLPSRLPPARLIGNCRAAAEESAAAPPESGLQAPPEAVTPAWQNAIDLLQSGENFKTTILTVNKSGVLVSVGKLTGFVPYKLMNRTFLNTIDKPSWTKTLLGREIEVKVVQVIVPEQRLVCSEKAVLLDKAATTLKPGDTVAGNVVSLHSFGAFVEILEPKSVAGVEVILPLREISWDWIATVNEKLSKGDAICAKVIQAQPSPKAKVVISLKRLQDDPLRETLDRVLPLEQDGEGYAQVASVPADVPTGVEDILHELSKEDGIVGVTLGRRVQERRTVSQDLELWISRETVSDGFNLVARAGRNVQEIHVTTAMSGQDMRTVVQRVLKRIS
jgi:predicted RNA-binding protein with RPS1 domain